MRVNAVIQARAGSTRLPGKVLEPLGSLTVLEWVIRAARAARLVDTVVVATTVETVDDAVARAAEAAGALVVRGSEDDVLSRYLLAAEEHPCDAVVRLTSDCPMLDPEVIDLVVSTWLGAPHLDYVSSVLVRTLPHGMDVELATTDALHRADAVATAHHRTHVTSAIYTDPEAFDVVGLVFAPLGGGPAHHARHARGPRGAAGPRGGARGRHRPPHRDPPRHARPPPHRAAQRRGRAEAARGRLMRVLLRCDGGPGVGVGHVMRSLALAEEATSRGHEVSLAGIVEGDLLTRAVAGSGLLVHPVAGRLGDSGDLPDRAVWDTHDVVHVDSYTVSSAVRESLGSGPVLSVMHDGHDGRRPADLAIDPTLGAEATPAPEDAAWSVRGGRWVPLRPAIRRLSGRHPDRSTGERLDVVVVMGGADPARCAPDAVAAVQAAATRAGVAVDVLVVASPETRDRLTAMTERPGATVTVIDPTPDLASRLAVADLVVSAAGTTVWELCALRTPMALVCVVDNQQTGYDEVISRGMAAGLGTPADLSAEETTTTLADLLGDPAARAELAETADRVVDGLGAWRIVSAWEAVVAGARPAAQGGTPRHTTLRGRPRRVGAAGHGRGRRPAPRVAQRPHDPRRLTHQRADRTRGPRAVAGGDPGA